MASFSFMYVVWVVQRCQQTNQAFIDKGKPALLLQKGFVMETGPKINPETGPKPAPKTDPYTIPEIGLKTDPNYEIAACFVRGSVSQDHIHRLGLPLHADCFYRKGRPKFVDLSGYTAKLYQATIDMVDEVVQSYNTREDLHKVAQNPEFKMITKVTSAMLENYGPVVWGDSPRGLIYSNPEDFKQ
jgi:hypothetical protein